MIMILRLYNVVEFCGRCKIQNP